jgi:hypothetical protein
MKIWLAEHCVLNKILLSNQPEGAGAQVRINISTCTAFVQVTLAREPYIDALSGREISRCVPYACRSY